MALLIRTVSLLKVVRLLGKLTVLLIATVPLLKVQPSQVPLLKVRVLPGVMLKIQLVQLLPPMTALNVELEETV